MQEQADREEKEISALMEKRQRLAEERKAAEAKRRTTKRGLHARDQSASRKVGQSMVRSGRFWLRHHALSVSTA